MLSRLVLVAIVSTSCTSQSAPLGLRAPDPNGCYVIVYDQPDFRGTRDVFNGPARWPRLEGLRSTNEESWRNRIRSLRVGSAATMTAYTDAGLKGNSRQFVPAAEHPRLEHAFSARIESLELSCR